MLSFLLCAALCLVTWRSSAAAPARVLVMAPAQSRLERRLAAELDNLGMVALLAAPDASAVPSAELLASAGAFAALRVVDALDVLEIWMVERQTGRAVLRESLAGLAEGRAEDVAVLHAIEVLRAELIEMDPPQPAPPVPEIAVPAAAEPRPPGRWFVAAGPALLVGEHDLSPRPGLLAGLGFEPRSYALEAWFAWAAQDTARSTAGSATISPRHLGLGALGIFGAPGAKWRLAAGGAVALQWLHVQGRAQPGYAAGSDDHVTVALLGRGQLVYAPLARLRCALDVQAGPLMQRTRVRLAGEDVAIWGRALVLTSLRAEVLW